MTTADFQEFLDDISNSLIAADYPVWRRRVVLPLTVLRDNGTEQVTDEANMRAVFDRYVQFGRMRNIDQIIRRPISLEDCGDGQWHGTYETNLIAHGHRVVEPYVSTALLHVWPSGLRMSSIFNACRLELVAGIQA